jgi:Probable cobalt transporter subunit (CbtA)
MVRNLLLRGMLVGVFAGLLASGFARIFGEPQVDRAIAYEEQMSQAKGEAAGAGTRQSRDASRSWSVHWRDHL